MPRPRYRLSEQSIDALTEETPQPSTGPSPDTVQRMEQDLEGWIDGVRNDRSAVELRTYWRSVIHREPTEPELAWLELWRMTKAGNRMLVGYVRDETGVAVSIRFILAKGEYGRGGSVHRVLMYRPANAKDHHTGFSRACFPNVGDAALYVKRELERAKLVFSVENPGGLGDVLRAETQQRGAELRTTEFRKRTSRRGFGE